MANFRTTNKKQLAARVLCGLLLSTYLTGVYSLPVAWGAPGEITDDSYVAGKFVGTVDGKFVGTVDGWHS